MEEKNPLEGLIGAWPQPGDQLITSEGHGWYNAWLPNVRSLSHYIEGYYRASEIIGGEVERNPGVAGINFLVYPLVYICRHCLELSLKDAIGLHSKLKGTRYTYPDGHHLSAKWNKVKLIIEEQFGDSYSTEVESVTKMIGELDAIDEKSTAFRYNIDKSGNPSIPTLEEINVVQFRGAFEGIYNFLFGVRSQLDDCISNQAHA